LRPLYNSLASASLSLGSGHSGLWYEKFCDRWSTDWSLEGKLKFEWIQTVAAVPTGARELLDEAAARILRMVEARSGEVGVFRTESRFVTGLGRSHPVKNGFAWHPTLGTPYLPGSSVKGLIRAWAESGGDQNENELLMELLGAPDRVGRVIALDAIPIAPVRLAADVMTPHFHGWSEKNPPGDWMSPRPIPFLVTEAHTSFVFSLLPRDRNDRDCVAPAWSWLMRALGFGGAGAKTAVGYGRFSYDQAATEEWRHRLLESAWARRAEAVRRELERSPEGRWRLLLEGKSEAEILELVRLHLEKDPISDAFERTAFVNAVNATALPELWRKGKKRERATQVGEKKLRERARLLR
jgi:CRISPR-associated protein Cmr6